MKKGRLFVISGPSGTGKGTICRRLTETVDVELSVSMTTRKPRPKETDGLSYYFVSEQRFNEVLAEGGFLEHAEVYGRKYGTPKAPVAAQLEAGRDVILEIDIQGALQVRENEPSGIFIYILPPSMEELRNRIVGRGSESKTDIDHRMDEALAEIACLNQYDYCVVNGELEEAVCQVAAIIVAERARVRDGAVEMIESYRALPPA
jgi:guanylate kinase